MMSPGEVVPAVADLPRLVFGTLLFLLPGLAAGDRFVPGRRWGLLLAPVLSFTLLPMAAILLQFATGTPVTGATTASLAAGLALMLGARRLSTWFDPEPDRAREATRRLRQRATSRLRLLDTAALCAVALAVGAVHFVPHLPGGPVAPLEAPAEILDRLKDPEGHYRLPVHADEHTHMAFAAAVARHGQSLEPYRGETVGGELFHLRGHVHERGFQAGLAQWSLLSGGTLAMPFVWGPALWAAYLAALVWLALGRGVAGLAGAAGLVILPTDVLHMGAGFLVPIAFGLAWVVAAMLAAQRMRGGRRVLALLLLVTGAFFIHLVAGAASIVAALCGAAALPLRWRRRLALALATLLPLVWIGPAVVAEVLPQLGQPAGHPVDRGVFVRMGIVPWLLAALGCAAAFARTRPKQDAPSAPLAPPPAVPDPGARAWALLLVAMLAVVVSSLVTGRTSLATYYRAIHPLMLALAATTGVGVAALVRWVQAVPDAASRATTRRPRPRMHVAVAAVALLLLAGALLPAVAAHLATPYYHVHDERTWQRGQVLAAHARDGDVFLSEPWQAMAIHAMSGATPWTVLRPGGPPERGGDWDYYVRTQGASEAWLRERGIRWVVADQPPNAPHDPVSAGVFRLR